MVFFLYLECSFVSLATKLCNNSMSTKRPPVVQSKDKHNMVARNHYKTGALFYAKE